MEKEKINDLKKALENASKDVEIKGKGAILKSDEQRKAEQEFEDWKNKKDENYKPIKEFYVAHELLKVLINTSEHYGLIFKGEGGIGKTLLTMNTIKNTLEPNQWEYSNGYTTPLALYEFLYHNREKDIIILDDIEGIFNNKLALSILKGALWESDGQRICQYSSKSDKAEFPQKFIMKAKLIILCNEIPRENDPSTRALISRTIKYNLGFNFEEKMKICSDFIQNDNSLLEEQKVLVRTILKKNITQATYDFNFRTLRKLISFVKYDINKAEELFKATTERDEDKDIYLRGCQMYQEVKDQISYFCEKTGKTRRTFFRIKKKVGDIVTLKKDVTLYTQNEGLERGFNDDDRK